MSCPPWIRIIIIIIVIIIIIIIIIVIIIIVIIIIVVIVVIIVIIIIITITNIIITIIIIIITFSGGQGVPAADEVSTGGSVPLALGQPLAAGEEVLPLGVVKVRHHHLVKATMVTQ